jgi:hypothetical protein
MCDVGVRPSYGRSVSSRFATPASAATSPRPNARDIRATVRIHVRGVERRDTRLQRRPAHPASPHARSPGREYYGCIYASKKSLDSIIDKVRRFTRRASIAHSPTCCAGSTRWSEVGAATYGPGGEHLVVGTCGSVGANIVERARRIPLNWAIRLAGFLPRSC